jgi:hypothetical protein
LENRKMEIGKKERKDPTVHPANAAGWGGGAKNKRARMGHPKAFFGIKARPPALARGRRD